MPEPIGRYVLKFSQNLRLQFYRYGGEEFLAMAYGYNREELLSIAESLRIAAQDLHQKDTPATISIGVAYCGDEQVRNYENIIDRADKAVYAAKRLGRNQVFIVQNEEQTD